ncbi:hypothetical protein GCM10023116_10010 [Kistimonas scapharcae]|uniref:histidine kinase n=1 Tax=Kistimonas scapharcae TaxID=1036133 RepID=A0ABP8UZV8_9GAMM
MNTGETYATGKVPSNPRWLLACLFLMEILVSAGLYIFVLQEEENQWEQDFKNQSFQLMAAAENGLKQIENTLTHLTAFAASHDSIARNTFTHIAQPVWRENNDIQAVEWIPRVPHAQRDAMEKAIRDNGFPTFRFTERNQDNQLVTAGKRDVYYPVYYLEPHKGNEAAMGFDLGSNIARLTAINNARDTGKTSASSPINLLQANSQHRGILLFSPVFSGDNRSPETFRGSMLIVLNMNTWFSSLWRDHHLSLPSHVTLVDISDTDTPHNLVSFPDTASGTLAEKHLRVSRLIPLADRRWQLVIEATEKPLSHHMVAGGGAGALFLSMAVLTLVIRQAINRKQLVEKTVIERTQQLIEAKERTEHERRFVTSILDNTLDGIITINAKGMIASFNKGAQTIFGYTPEEVRHQNVKMLMPEPYHSQHDGYLANYLKTGDAKVIGIGRDVIGLRKNGEEFPLWLGISEIESGGETLFIGMVRDCTEKKQAEDKLLEAKERAEQERLFVTSILDNTLDGIITINAKGMIASFNKGAQTIFGYTPEDVLHQNVKMLMPEPYHSQHDGYLANYLQTGDAKVIGIGRDVIGLRKNGEEFPLWLGISEIESGGETLFIGMVRDCTEKKQAEDKLLEAKERAEQERLFVTSILDNTLDGIITINAKGMIASFNKGAQTIFGYTPEEVLHQNVKMLMPEPYHSQHDGYLANYLQTGDAKVIGIGRDVIGLRKNGEEFPLWLGISEIESGGETLFIGMVRDCTEKKLAEDKLLEAKERAEQERLFVTSILDNALDGIITINAKGKIASFNKAAQTIFGYSPEDVLHQNVKMLMPEPYRSEHDGYLANYLGSGDAKIIGIGREVPGLRKNGEEFPLWLGISEIKVGDESLFIGIVRDRTERKRIEEMRKNIISIASHELKTPLTAMHGALAMLQSGIVPPESPQFKELLAIVENNCKRLSRMVTDMLNLERIESGALSLDMATTDLCALVNTAITDDQYYAQQYQVTLQAETPDEPVETMVDADKLHQVLTNLISNAVKASEAGDSVTVRLSRQASDSQVMIAVEDHGTGIPKSFQDHVFDKFAQADDLNTRKHEGTGLGLSICKSIIMEHGGTIDFESTEGEGTTFYVRLPLA